MFVCSVIVFASIRLWIYVDFVLFIYFCYCNNQSVEYAGALMLSPNFDHIPVELYCVVRFSV